MVRGEPPPNNFERGKSPPKLYIVGKGIYQRCRFILDIGKKFGVRNFMSDFSEMVEIWAIFGSSNIKISYIILKHVTWRFHHIICFAKYLNFAQKYFRISRNLLLFILLILIFRKTNYIIGFSRLHASK